MKILVISLAGIGDTLLATPLIHELRLNYPDAVLDALVMWTGSRDILAGNPHLNSVHHCHMINEGPWRSLRFLLRLRRRRYDIALNTYPQSKTEYRLITRILGAGVRVSHRYDNRRWWDGWLVNREVDQSYDRHSVDQNLALLEALNGRRMLASHSAELFLSEDERAWARRMAEERGWRGRRMIGLDFYRELIEKLLGLRPDLQVLLFGGPEERQDHEWLHSRIGSPRVCVPETREMKQAAALLEHCHAFLSIDSALMHLAAAVRVPHQFVIETATFNKTIEPYDRPYVLIPNPALQGRNLDYYRYDGEGIRGTPEALEALMRAVSSEKVFQTLAPCLTLPDNS
ncbi:MAG: glycosyltransferase family 9 protein [Verrucomicrobia bacterium]|nr:glycosyltransferase family 9 protein [Verrucomicrobiota bacterium]